MIRFTTGLFFKAISYIRRVSWLVVWHSVYYFLKRPIRFVYLAGVLVIFMIFLSSGSTTDSYNIDPPMTGNIGKHEVASLPYVEESHIQNGNSAFTNTVLKEMSAPDLSVYSNNFLYAMTQVHANTPYRWQASEGLFGEIIPQEAFLANSGIYCRKFEELVSYGGRHESFTGLSCQRRIGGWCRLRPNSAHTCEINPPNNISVFLRNLF